MTNNERARHAEPQQADTQEKKALTVELTVVKVPVPADRVDEWRKVTGLLLNQIYQMAEEIQ